MKTEGLTFEIRKKYKELRPSEQKAADAVLEGKIKISDCTIKEFADLAGVSQPTVIRFANAMGVKGYKELKRKAIEEESRTKDAASEEEILEYPVCRTDRLLDIPAKVIMTNIRHLEETLKGISKYEFSRAVHALEKAENISVFAVENSACAAEDFVTKMSYMGKKVYFNKDSYMQNVNAVNLTSKDVAVGISHTGNSKQTVNALACAKEAGAFTISVTNFENAVINRYADVILCTKNEQYMYGNAIFSRCAQISIVDMLYIGVFLMDYDCYSKKLNNGWNKINSLVNAGI